MNNKINIGGVTEHFNLPWNLAVEQGKFEAAGVPLHWKFFPGGTGVMTEALKTGELDLAILLTEGFVSAVYQGLKAKVVKEYIISPLGWGIFTGADSPLYSVYNRLPKKYCISKLGSGSHLMALIHAEQRGIKISASDFIEVRSLDGAIEALSNNETQIFYWEKYTTKPFVVNKTLRMIGEFNAPWSSFLIVASNTALQHKRHAIHTILNLMNEECKAFVQSSQTIPLLQQRFRMSETDARDWLQATVWSADFTVRKQSLQNAQQALIKTGCITGDLEIEKLCDEAVLLK